MPVIDVVYGTPEQAWRGCQRLRSLPEFAWADPCRVVVIAPHPDDETLGIGGTLCTLARRGFAIQVVALTDGEASHPESSTFSRASLAALRARERTTALARLGLERATLIRLGARDGELTQTRDLSERLAWFIHGAAYCFAPFRRDGHPDHDAAGEAAARACQACAVQLCEYPVWAWQWARPDGDDLPWARARRVALEADVQRAKASALAAYRSRIAPLSSAASARAVLTPAVLEHFSRGFEVLFV